MGGPPARATPVPWRPCPGEPGRPRTGTAWRTARETGIPAEAGLELSTADPDASAGVSGTAQDTHYLAYGLGDRLIPNPPYPRGTGTGADTIRLVREWNPPASFGAVAHPWSRRYPWFGRWPYPETRGFWGLELGSGFHHPTAGALAAWDEMLATGDSVPAVAASEPAGRWSPTGPPVTAPAGIGERTRLAGRADAHAGAEITLRWASTEEFGPVAEVDVVLNGRPLQVPDLVGRVAGRLRGEAAAPWPELAPGALRVALRTTRGGYACANPIWLDGPTT